MAMIGAILAAGATAIVIVGQRAALTRFSAAVPVSIPWIPIGEITAACAAVASVLAAWRTLRGKVVDLADLRE